MNCVKYSRTIDLNRPGLRYGPMDVSKMSYGRMQAIALGTWTTAVVELKHSIDGTTLASFSSIVTLTAAGMGTGINLAGVDSVWLVVTTAEGSDSAAHVHLFADDTVQYNFTGVGGDALVANPLSQFAATTSAQLAGVISNETGSGALVFATSPTLVTPALGTPSSGVLTSCTGLPATSIVNGTLFNPGGCSGGEVGYPVLGPGAVATVSVEDRAYFLYLGKCVYADVIQYVQAVATVAGGNATPGELGIFSSASGPAGSATSLSISKVEATGTISSLAGTGIIVNTSAFTTALVAGTHYWLGIRTAITAGSGAEPTFQSCAYHLGTGCLLTTATAGALTGAGPWTGITPSVVVAAPALSYIL